MKNANKKRSVAVALGFAVASMPAFAALAQTNLGLSGSVNATVVAPGASTSVSVAATVSAATKTLITKAQTDADEEITRRDDALNALNTRVQAMQNISTADKANLSAMIQSQLGAMGTLEAKIQTDASANNTSSLKADIKSITTSYRIFALVIPQGAIEAAADRIMDVAGIMQTLSGKLQARISSAEATGADMTTSTAALADMNAKVADANTQAQAAVNETASLQPDQGNATVMASNTTALKDARTKIQTAQQDLVAARADVKTILAALSINVTSTVQ